MIPAYIIFTFKADTKTLFQVIECGCNHLILAYITFRWMESGGAIDKTMKYMLFPAFLVFGGHGVLQIGKLAF